MSDGDTYLGLYEGVVTDRNDDQRRGRVCVLVEGVTPEKGIWAVPFGAPGGGEKNRGFKFTPEVGAEVVVFFKMGDPDHPRFLAGAYGAPDGVSDMPQSSLTDANTGEEIPDEEVPNVHVIDTRRFEIVIDDREGFEKLLIRDKKTPSSVLPDDDFGAPGDFIEFDAREGRNDLIIRATRSITLKAIGGINLDAATVQVNGRLVLPTSKDI